MHQSDEYYQDRISELECRVGELEEELDTVRAERVSAEAEVERMQGLREELERMKTECAKWESAARVNADNHHDACRACDDYRLEAVALRAELERERKAAAAMREAIEQSNPKLTASNANGVAWHVEQGESFGGLSSDALAVWLRDVAKRFEALNAALSTDAGRGYVRVEDARKELMDEHDTEIGEFQDEVRALVIRLSGAPDNAIDGKGSDAGWQEFTLAEIKQGFAYLVDQRDALQAQVAQLREALEDLVGQACEFIGPDEVGTPECVCCHMELGEDLKGHRSDCLANAIMGHSRALSAPAPRAITAEDVRSLVEALQKAENAIQRVAGINDENRLGWALKDVDAALAHAKAKGWLEDKP